MEMYGELGSGCGISDEVDRAIQEASCELWPDGSRPEYTVASFDQIGKDWRVQGALQNAGEVFGRSHRDLIRYWAFERDYDVVMRRSFL